MYKVEQALETTEHETLMEVIAKLETISDNPVNVFDPAGKLIYAAFHYETPGVIEEGWDINDIESKI